MLEIQTGTNKVNSKTCLRIILLLLLMGFWILAQAQTIKGSSSERPSAHIKNRDNDSPEVAVTVEHEIPITISTPSIQLNTCQANISTRSHQRDTLARVVTTIEQESCTTSTGEYDLLVHIEDENGDYRDLLFSKTWEQKDDSPMEFSQDYPIGENVTLRRVMTQGVRCECTELESN